MIELNSKNLSTTLLDPIEDRNRFGSRYCTGGYIFQITDAKQGPLLSGPTYPNSFNWFDGQGIPDSFFHNPLRAAGNLESEALVIGIGMCDLSAGSVTTHSDWEVETSANRAIFRTNQTLGPYRLDLERIVALTGRTVRSSTSISNTGDAPIPLRWFPHPFFPQPADDELCKLNFDVEMPSNEGFEFAESGYIRRKNWPWEEGYYQPLDHRARTNPVILQRHPKVGIVTGSCGYVPSLFPIWGNRITFSWEPFLEVTIAENQSYRWHIDYDF